jgi:type IV/VI secretion system ImpK/VasF family protein
MSSSTADPGAGRAVLTAAARGFFLAVAALHSESTRSTLNPAQFHAALEQQLAGFEAEARSGGADASLLAEAKYALVALADDLALHIDWDHRQVWSHYLLELRHFGTAFGGANFFTRLRGLQQRIAGTHDPALREQTLGALEIFLTCLRLGFRGQFRNAPQQALDQEVAALQQILTPGDSRSRARAWPEGYAGSGTGRIVRRGRLWWWPIPAAAGAAILLWYVFSWVQIGRVDDAVRKLGGAPAAEGTRK